MKYLKKYKLFESNKTDEIREYIFDILIELEDLGYSYVINKKNMMGIEDIEFDGFKIMIKYQYKFTPEGSSSRLFELKNISNILLSLIDYMESQGYNTDINGVMIKSVKKVPTGVKRKILKNNIVRSKGRYSILILEFKN